MASTVVVTGASRGIGRAVAEAFAEAGHAVWALARTEAALAELAAAHPGRIRPLRMDAADAQSVVAAARTVLADGAPRVLVNNAGIALAAPLKRTSTDDYRRVMAVNVEAPFLLCRELMPAMADAGGGRVVNVASTAALKGFQYTSAYCASKHALLGLTRALALEYAKKQVTVNAVCPGWTDTDMLQQSVDNIVGATGRTPESARAQLAGMNAMGTLIRPRDVAALCLFLASDAASTVTGAAYTMDGGEAA
ncbi:MAG: hypothetical protein RL653_3558 [Pseudomonadota bacterium]|jgi:NAD(P)-dependent dehydrogenase (short-subunit alcohol dehydrogenase family)